VQSTCALLCIRDWSLHGYIKDSNVGVAARLLDVMEDKKEELKEGWDHILL